MGLAPNLMDAQLDQTTCPTTVLLVCFQNVRVKRQFLKKLYIFSFLLSLFANHHVPLWMPNWTKPFVRLLFSGLFPKWYRVKRPFLKKFYIFFFLLSLFAKHHATLFMDGTCIWYTQRKVFANTYQSIGGLRCWMLWVWVFADTNLCLRSNF